MISSQIAMYVLRPDAEGDDVELEVAIGYEADAYGTRVADFGETVKGSTIIKLTPDEIEHATDRAWREWGEERHAS